MLKSLMGAAWRGAPAFVRRWGVWLAQPRFTVTAGAVVEDERGRVLLLRHVFRRGSGWGIPGGFIKRGEQPTEAVRREIREEIGLELDEVELAFVRTLTRPKQVEIIFRCRMNSVALEGRADSLEIYRAEWFERGALQRELSADQCRLIERVLGD